MVSRAQSSRWGLLRVTSRHQQTNNGRLFLDWNKQLLTRLWNWNKFHARILLEARLRLFSELEDYRAPRSTISMRKASVTSMVCVLGVRDRGSAVAEDAFRFAVQEILIDGVHHSGHFPGSLLLRIHVGSKISGDVAIAACDS
jgi:hypothetical protein